MSKQENLSTEVRYRIHSRAPRSYSIAFMLTAILGMSVLSACKYNKACLNGECAPGEQNAVNSYSPSGYLGSTPSTMRGSQEAVQYGQPVNPSANQGSGSRYQGSGTR